MVSTRSYGSAIVCFRVADRVYVDRDTTDIPPDSQITNPIGRVVLGFETSESLNLMIGEWR